MNDNDKKDENIKNDNLPQDYSKKIYEKLCEIKTIAKCITILLAGFFVAFIVYFCMS